MIENLPPLFGEGDINVTPEEIYEGEDATVTATIVNDGDFPGTYEATIRVNSTAKKTILVDIAGNDSISISFDLDGLEPGIYQVSVGGEANTLTVLEIIVPTPAVFTISPLEISPDEVDIGEDVNISVRIDNTGETEGVCQLVCKVNGVVVDEKEITLAGGSRETVVFTTTFNEAGNKTIEVNELSGSLGVKEAVEEEPSPDPGTIAEIPTQETPEEPAPESRWWIAGPVVGVCAVIAAFVIYLVRRKRIQNMI